MFLESTLFLQKLPKFQKIVWPCFGNSIASRTSRMPQSRVHYRDSSRLTSDSLAGNYFSCKKDLEYFSNFGFFMLFTAQVGDLFASGWSSRKGYIEIFVAQFATLSRVELPVVKNT